jgi:hypothetical protein
MSNTEASEENVKSPSTYGNKGYEEYRKKEKKKRKRSHNLHQNII